MTKYNAFQIVKDFEEVVCNYTGAPYCVAVNSCTNALFLALKYHRNNQLLSVEEENGLYYEKVDYIEIPKHTYLSVPMQILHAGFRVKFRDNDWRGIYQLKPLQIWDMARQFTSGMINSIEPPGQGNYYNYYGCVSFHWSKILGIQQGGAILHNDIAFDRWARKARFDGRTEGVAPKDDNPILGWHMYMSPEIAAEGLVRLMHLPRHNPDLPNDDYPDLSKLEIFK